MESYLSVKFPSHNNRGESMARISIEEQWWSDPRREALAKRIGDPEKADGIMLRLWLLSQRFWAKGELIPEHVFDTIEHGRTCVELNLARVEQDGVYVRGSGEYHQWLRDMRGKCSKAGKASAQARAQKLGTSQPKRRKTSNIARTSVEQKATTPNPLTLTPTLSPTSTLTNSPTGVPESKKEKAPTRGAIVWEAYALTYKKKYGVEPARNARTNSLCAQLATRLGHSAPEVVVFFVNHPKSFYVSKSHDLRFCIADAESLHTEWQRGRPITNSDIKEYNKALDRNSLSQAIERGEV